MTDDASPENLRKFLESDDPALVLMGLSMAKGSGVPEALLPTILGLYMWDDDKSVRAAARTMFFKHAPAEIQAKVRENWKPNYRTLKVGDRFSEVIRSFLEAFKSQDDFAEIGLESLIKALRDGDYKAAEALGKIGEMAMEPLIKALGDRGFIRAGPQALVRINVAKALGEIGDARAVETLIGVLSDDYQVLCRFASEALGKIGKPAVEPLIKALEGDNVYVRIYAAATLGEIGDKRAVEPLIKALGDDDCWVRENAVWALDGWKWKPEMDEHRVVYLLAKHDWDALVKWGERAVEPLIKAHRDGYWKAVCALGNIGDTRAVELLIKALGDDVQLVRSHAARALGRICDVREDTFSNVEPLIKVLSDNPSALDPYGGSDVRDAAKEALEKLGHEVE